MRAFVLFLALVVTGCSELLPEQQNEDARGGDGSATNGVISNSDDEGPPAPEIVG